MDDPPETQGNEQKGIMQFFAKSPKIKVLAAVSILLWSLPLLANIGTTTFDFGKDAPTAISRADGKKMTGIVPPGDPGEAIEAAIPVRVGLNSKGLKGNEASVFSDSGLNLGEYVWITNDDDVFMATIRVKVVRIEDRGDNPSRGQMFLSGQATKILRIFENKPGIRTLSLRQQNPLDPHKKSAARIDINVKDINVVNLIKK